MRQAMRFSPLSLSVLLPAALAATLAAAETRELTQEMSLQGHTRLDIDAGPGDLVITGTTGDAVQARLTLEFPDDWTDAQVQEVLDDYLRFEFSSAGERLALSANWGRDDDDRRGRDWPVYGWDGDDGLFFREVAVQVPANLALRIDDGSGDADLSDLTANVDITDGSGSLRVTNLTGSLTVNDGSGDVDLTGITGEVEIEDGSGDVEVRDVGGGVSVRDGSGDVDVEDIEGDLRVRDGSGRVNTRTIAGEIDIRD